MKLSYKIKLIAFFCFRQYLEQDMDSNTSEISAYNMQQDYSYDAPNDVSISGAGK